MTSNLPIEIYEGVVHTSPWRRLARRARTNTFNLFRNRAAVTTMALLAAAFTVTAVAGLAATLTITAGTLATLGLYRARHPVSFRRHVTLPIWACLLSVFKYRRRWRTVLKKSGIIETFEDPPRIHRVTATLGTRNNPGSVHTIRFKMNDGHTLNGTYNYNLPELTPAFSAVAGSMKSIDRKKLVELQLITKDPLVGDIPHYPTTAEQLFTGYPLAKCDDTKPWTLKLVGTHIAVGGETGSGKGSVFWRIIKAAQPARQAGLARIIALDHKGGTELGLGGRFINDQFISPYFDQFSYQSPKQSVRLLDYVIREMQRRQQLMLGKARLWNRDWIGPDGDEWILVACDEIGALTAWDGDRKTKSAAANKISIIINQARAFGITFVYAGQDLRKDIAVFRGQTPVRLQGKTREPWDVDNMLGPGAWRYGARADEIPDGMEGTFYVARDGQKGFNRTRWPFNTDDMITEDPHIHDLDTARKMAEAAANHYTHGIERFGGFA